MTKTEKTRKQKKRLLLPALAAACILSLAVMVYALIVTGKTGKEQTAFIPPPFEQSAVKGTPEVKPGTSIGDRLKGLGYSNLDAVDYQVAICGAPVIEDGKAILYLTNPETNQVWIKVRLLDDSGRVLGESGLLRPGEYAESIALDMEAVEAAQAAVNDAEGVGIPITLRIMAYEPETYHSAGAVSLSTTLAVGP
ncbi:MAG: hypothetical protein Q4E24_07940 [bacterium]|nr:hypothetical protein [bacterium]